MKSQFNIFVQKSDECEIPVIFLALTLLILGLKSEQVTPRAAVCHAFLQTNYSEAWAYGYKTMNKQDVHL